MVENKSLNQRKIIRHLYFSNSLSCSELSSKINKSLPIATKLLNELVHQGSVVETGYARSTGGRRPIVFSLKQDVLYIIAIAVDQYITRIALMDTQNRCINDIHKFELLLSKNTQALPVLVDRINQIIKNAGIDKKRIAGIGIGMPGFVDSKKGVNYTFFENKGESISKYIERETGLPVYIDNDSSVIALAELKFGAARGKKNAMVVNIGWGVGLGMILNGELFRGNSGFAGEFSHIPIFSNGKLCTCGKSGCLETETSLRVIIEKAQQGLQSGRVSVLKLLSIDHLEEASEDIMTASGRGDQFAVELFSEAGYNIGRGVAILIHILNPEVIVLSGRGSAAGKIWQAPIQHALNEHCIPRLAANTSIEISTLGYEAELIGAAALVMDNYEKDPLEAVRKLKPRPETN